MNQMLYVMKKEKMLFYLEVSLNLIYHSIFGLAAGILIGYILKLLR